MTRLHWRILLGIVGATLVFILWTHQGAPAATNHDFPPVYAYDPTTKSWFTVPGNTVWPCQTPSGDKVGLEVVMAKAPDGTLSPVLLSRTEVMTDKGISIEGIAQQSGKMRRLICDPATMAWVDEDSKAGLQLYNRIKDLAGKGYALDVRPTPTSH
jgi:hypothetical protein